MARGYARTLLGQVHYVRIGQGTPLLLLAAAGRSSRMFADLLPELSDGFDVIALDTPGFGNSDPLPPGTTIEALADAAVEALDNLGVTCTAVYGLHTGNKIGTAMAVRHPGRVSKLILAGQSHSLIPDQETRNAGIRDLIQSYVDFEHRQRGADEERVALVQRVRALLHRAEPDSGRHPDLGGAVLDHVLDEIQATGTRTLYLANFGYDLGRAYTEIRVPTLVLEIATEAETRAVGRQGEAVVRLIPGSSLTTLEVPDGHALTLEDRPKELGAIIRAFLG